MKTQFNLEYNLVPLQSLSDTHQHKLIAFFGSPYDAQSTDNLKVYKSPSEKEIFLSLCIIESKCQLPRKMQKALCGTCSQLSPESLSFPILNTHLNGNKSGHKCMCHQIVLMNQCRKKSGGQPLSNSQVCKLMQDVLTTLKY